MMKRNRMAAWSVLMALVFLLAACGKAPAPAQSPAPAAAPAPAQTPAPAAAPAPAPAAEPADEPVVIGVALASSTNPLYVAMEKGIRARAAELGVEVRFVVPDEDQVRQVDGINDLITQRVDAIIASPITVEGSIVAYEEANKAGIPMLSIARNLNRDDLEWAMIGQDWEEAGRAIGRWLADRLGGQGTIGMLRGPAGASFAEDMARGFKEVMAGYPGIQIVAELHSPLTREQGLHLAENILTANPDVSAIYATNDELALGAVQAAEEFDRLGELVITGFNGTPPAVAAVREGQMHMTTALKPETWGRLGLETAVKVARERQKLGLVQIETVVVDDANVHSLTAEDLN